MKPNIVITMGDPAGIGPEVALKALASPEILRLANFLFIGDGFVINKVSRGLRAKLSSPFLDLSNVRPKSFCYGASRPEFGKAAIEYIDKALELLLSRRADAVVTAPINKTSVISSGMKGFEGHTEYLAKKALARDVAMMFVGKQLKITLATRHIPLKDVSKRLSVDSICRAIMITDAALKKYFKIPHPRIGVAGLNPHAGEGGVFGDEEKRIIMPAIKRASGSIRGIAGPVPPDVIFYEALAKKYDAVIAMYHDQALIPFKLFHFKDGVNVTLGLPFVRTSPDHGTAFDIAGKSVADPSSMEEAIILAARLVNK